jgi:predicted transcriptional regulator
MAMSVKIDDELQHRIEELGRLRLQSPGAMMQDAITQYVAREEAREAMKSGAKAAWAEYKNTGLHLNGPEIMGWLDKWGEDNEAPPPECHV